MPAILAGDEIFVSTDSLWEIAIKHSLGRGDLPVTSVQALQAAPFGKTTPYSLHVCEFLALSQSLQPRLRWLDAESGWLVKVRLC